MRESPYERQSGGVSVHVKDCYVWAEIQYLDSPTDYREYIHIRHTPVFSLGDVTVEDERVRGRFESLGALSFAGLLACIFLLLIARS